MTLAFAVGSVEVVVWGLELKTFGRRGGLCASLPTTAVP
jgi:hypothetical protein